MILFLKRPLFYNYLYRKMKTRKVHASAYRLRATESTHHRLASTLRYWSIYQLTPEAFRSQLTWPATLSHDKCNDNGPNRARTRTWRPCMCISCNCLVHYVSHGLSRISFSPSILRELAGVDRETRQSHFLRACVVKVASVCGANRARTRLLLFRDRDVARKRNCLKVGDQYF